MKRFLVGTAGHIDHGKTALVKALTGIDADRLPEEKRRGITIDLGFAHAEWEGVRVSFVDVPGHERFVKNMLAGAGGIDAVLLVVAADESVMPQTREHFEIVRMLGIRRGVIAVTKADRVTPDLVEVTASDVRDLTVGSFLEKAPVLPVSARTGEGLPELRRALVALAAGQDPEREGRLVRLPIDRAFSIAGFGPVVTGSLVSGTVSREQKLELLPSRTPVRVRRLEVHGRETAEARAGERVSANLAGVELSELRRGLVLGAPGAFAITTLLTVRVDLLESAPEVSSGDRLSFHHFSAEERARVRPLDAETLLPGSSGRAQLRLSAPVAAAPGDRFVLRRLSPVETIGGGVVLDPLWPPIRRGREEAIPLLDRLEKGTLPDRIVLWVEQGRDSGAGEEELAARAGRPAEDIRAAAAAPLARGSIHALRRSPDRYVSESTLVRLAGRTHDEMARLLSSGASIGVSRRTLLARLLPRETEPRWAEAIEAALVARGVYVIAGEEARPPGRDDLAGPDRDLSARIAEVYRSRGLDPPSLPDVTREIGHKAKVIEGLAGYLVKKGTLLRLPGGWLISKEAVDGVTAKLRGSGRPSIDVGEFKEMFGLTRRLAIPILEYLDGAKITRRVGDKREILDLI
ncbi:MAG: selenocysteine-specific translation elongation factor [Acidobacteriota bacterium]|nr:selenocysteine-specific translation elongation factor [Acidobacteriota bacterium]